MTVSQILVKSDGLSPNAGAHSLPALLYRGLFGSTPSASAIEAHVRKLGWQPAWRYPMYKEAHFHSTTHELLAAYKGSADILLGGSDELARRGSASESESHKVVTLQAGDVLLLPAGYSHRAVEDRDGFQMVGSYPHGGAQWDSELRRLFRRLTRTVQ